MLSLLIQPSPRKYFWFAYTSSKYLHWVRTSRSLGQGQGHRNKKGLKSHPTAPSVNNMEYSCCKCSDCKSISVMWAGVCRLYTSDKQTDCVITKHVCLSCLQIICLWLKGSFVCMFVFQNRKSILVKKSILMTSITPDNTATCHWKLSTEYITANGAVRW